MKRNSLDLPQSRRLCRTASNKGVEGLFLAAVIVALSCGGSHAEPAPSTARTMSLPKLSGTAPTQPAWSPDGSRLAFLWNESGHLFRDIWVVPASGQDPKRITRFASDVSAAAPQAADSRPGKTSLTRLRDRANERANPGIGEIVWDADGTGIYFTYNGDVHHISTTTGDHHRLTTDGGRKSHLRLSPDKAYLSFLGNGDLWLHRFEGGYVVKATDVGRPSISRIPGGRFNALDAEFALYEWSSDSRFIALHYIDRQALNIMPVPSYLAGPEPVLNEVRRAYPGQLDAVKKIGVYSVSDGQVRYLPFPEPILRNILSFEWSPIANVLLVEQESDEGEYRWIYVADIENPLAEPQLLYQDHRPKRIYSVFTSHWNSDGRRIIFIDDNDGYYRLSYISASGGRTRQLTTGDYDVVSSSGRAEVVVSKATESIFYTAALPTPYERQIFVISDSGGSPTRITSMAGVHEELAVSPDGSWIAVIGSSDLGPAELYIVEVNQPAAQLRVTRSPVPEFYEYQWVEPRYVSFPSRLGDYTLHARIIEPPHLDRSARYPVILGNVYSNTVRNSWTTRGHPTAERISAFQQSMALEGGYITIQVDLRGSIGYGVAFREAFQGDWGGDDLNDLLSTVDYLKSLPYIDPERIGIWGNSYGGMLVLFALFEEPGVFAAGVAGAPAVDVSKFTSNDQHLSRRPHTHPEIFERSTLLNYGEGLNDPLMIIHGLHDDIVPFQSTLMMFEKLLLLGKRPDLVVVPTSPHWWAEDEHYAVYTFSKIREYFDRHLRNAE